MTIVIIGSNNSGKSLYAEKLTASFGGPLCYIATMTPYGETGLQKINKHRKQRAHYGFTTLERPCNISAINLPENTSALLEDVSNLLANAMFGENTASHEQVFYDIKSLREKCLNLVVVTISGIEKTPEQNSETHTYIDALNTLNDKLCDLACCVIEMNNNQPYFIKGGLNELG